SHGVIGVCRQQVGILREHADHGEVVDRAVRQRLVGGGRKRVSRWNRKQPGLARAGTATSIAKGPAIAMRRVSSITRVILRWLSVEQCRTLGMLREQTEFVARTEFYSSERAHNKATRLRSRRLGRALHKSACSSLW